VLVWGSTNHNVRQALQNRFRESIPCLPLGVLENGNSAFKAKSFLRSVLSYELLPERGYVFYATVLMFAA
jgi:hypothetical protein